MTVLLRISMSLALVLSFSFLLFLSRHVIMPMMYNAGRYLLNTP
jgi:hypothetical protein